MFKDERYDTAIIGGGLAGLALAIQLGKLGYRVILFEKEIYPFHKVCGEYISMESWPFLLSLGVPLETLDLPIIKKLIVSAPNGNLLHADLPLGGFGISRFTLDTMLKDLAIKNGVRVVDHCKVDQVFFQDEIFQLETQAGTIHSRTCCGAYGKRSNLDLAWKRPFTQNNSKRLNQFAGIKYHVRTNIPLDTIALHNFSNGYCGISRVEDGKSCLCYLTHTRNLKLNQQSIELTEKNVLAKNPALKNVLDNSEKLFAKPITIAQVSFMAKTQVEDHVILVGDAAGMIAPLCGNGMSMALHASKLAATQVDKFLKGEAGRQEMEKNYKLEWKRHFARRLAIGRMIQYFFGKTWLTNFFIWWMKRTPSFTRWLISQTHGKAF